MYEDHNSGNVCNLVFILNKERTVNTKKIRNEEKKKMWFADYFMIPTSRIYQTI